MFLKAAHLPSPIVISPIGKERNRTEEDMKFIELISAFDVLRDWAPLIICLIIAALILKYWIVGRIQHKPQIKDIVANGVNTDALVPRAYINDSNWLTRFLDPLVAFTRGPELIKRGYKLVICQLVSN